MIFSDSDIGIILELIAVISWDSRRKIRGEIKEFGITYPELGAIFALNKREGISQNELAKVIRTDRTTVMVIIDNLEKKGLLSRKPDIKDRRKNNIYYTAKGKEVFSAILPKIYKLFEPLTNHFTKKDLQRIKGYLTQIIECMKPEQQTRTDIHIK